MKVKSVVNRTSYFAPWDTLAANCWGLSMCYSFTTKKVFIIYFADGKIHIDILK